MNTPGSEPVSTEALSPAVESPVKAAPPALGRAVSADLEALKNDVEQAREMACDYQRQLAGKTNDHAELKVLFEKTQADFAHLQSGIEQLRHERHQLANEAMKAAALELKVARLTKERDKLQAEVDELRRERPVAPLPQRSTPSAPEREFISMTFAASDADDVTIMPTEIVPMKLRRR